MDRSEVYRHIIESEFTRKYACSNIGTRLERHVKALFDVDYIVHFNDETAPTICKAILGSGVEMTQKFHMLARRGADGDTRWIYDSHGYPRVQAREFCDRYVNGNDAQRNAMREYWLDQIIDRYENGYDDWRVSEDDYERVVSLVNSEIDKWINEQHQEALEYEQLYEDVKLATIRKQEYDKRQRERRNEEKMAALQAKRERQKREEMRSLKKQQKVSYMISLMS